MLVPWPPIHFVRLWTMTSAPWSNGRASRGANVLSTMSGTPRSCAIAAIASKSGTSSLGLPIVSRKTALVFSSIAGMKLDGSAESTNRTSMPSLGSECLKRFHVPP